MSYGRTISFSGKVCPVEKLRSDLTRTTPIRFVVSSFQISGRYGWSKGRVYDGERHAQSASQRGKFQFETGDTHSPSSLLSISTVRVSPYCFSCRQDFFSVLLFLFYIHPLLYVRSFALVSPSVPLAAILCTVSLRFLRLPPFSALALTFPRLTFVFYASTGVLTVYFDLDLREIS